MNIIGEIKIWTGLFEPPGWTFCDGKLLSKTEFAELFSVIGNSVANYGNVPFFQVPNTEPLAEGIQFIICYDGYLPKDAKISVVYEVIRQKVPPRIQANYIDPRKSKRFINRTIPQINGGGGGGNDPVGGGGGGDVIVNPPDPDPNAVT